MYFIDSELSAAISNTKKNTLNIFQCNMVLPSIITLAIGIYAGIYIDQNFKVPRVDEPSVLWEKVKGFIEQQKKDPPKPPPFS